MGGKVGQNRGLKTQELQTGQVGQFEGETMRPQGRLQWRLQAIGAEEAQGQKDKRWAAWRAWLSDRGSLEPDSVVFPAPAPAGGFHFLSLSSLALEREC